MHQQIWLNPSGQKTKLDTGGETMSSNISKDENYP
jgi:hypothetical protein